MNIQLIDKLCGHTFRIVGEPTDAGWRKDWEKHGKQEPYCRVTIHDGPDFKEGSHVTGYGGELWPMAWPEYFSKPATRSIYNVGHIYLTKQGAELFKKAVQ